MLIQKTENNDIIQVVKGCKQWKIEVIKHVILHMGILKFPSLQKKWTQQNNAINNLAKDLNVVYERCGARLLDEDIKFYAHLWRVGLGEGMNRR
jgi:hypothetical protein